MTPSQVTSSFPKMSQDFLPFIPAHDLQRLVAGSHQELTHHLAMAVKAESARFGSQSVQILASFDDRVVVLSEAGETYQIRYERALDGSFHLLGHEALPVQVVTRQNLRKYLQQEANAAATLFMQGLVSQANAKIAAMAPLVDAANASPDDVVFEQFRESRARPRVWTSTLTERHEAIQKYVEGAELPAAVEPRFSKLYDGATAPEELPQFQSLVRSNMQTLITRLSAVESSAKGALQTIHAVKGAAGEAGKSEALLQIEEFTSDLLADVATVREFAEDAVQNFAQVDLMARVFDSMAAEVTSFEVAGAFASKVATRLAEAGR